MNRHTRAPRATTGSLLSVALLFKSLRQAERRQVCHLREQLGDATGLSSPDGARLAQPLEPIDQRRRGQEPDDASAICDFLCYTRGGNPPDHLRSIALKRTYGNGHMRILASYPETAA